MAPEASLQPTFSVEHPGVFPGRHPVDDRYRLFPHARTEGRIENIPVHVMPVGIRTVEHHEVHPVGRRCFHHPLHGDEFGIEAATDVRDVEHDHIHIREHLPGGFSHLPVEGYDGDTRGRIDTVGDFLPGIGPARESVLRSKDLDNIYPTLPQQIERMTLRSDRRSNPGIRHPPSLQQGFPLRRTLCRINDLVALPPQRERETERQDRHHEDRNLSDRGHTQTESLFIRNPDTSGISCAPA